MAHSAEELAQEERRYMVVFAVLAVLTALEVGITLTGLHKHIIVGTLVILAVAKAALVAMYYMHLMNEKATLKWIAVTPMILCVFLLFMLMPDLTAVTRMITTARAGAPAAPAAH